MPPLPGPKSLEDELDELLGAGVAPASLEDELDELLGSARQAREESTAVAAERAAPKLTFQPEREFWGQVADIEDPEARLRNIERSKPAREALGAARKVATRTLVMSSAGAPPDVGERRREAALRMWRVPQDPPRPEESGLAGEAWQATKRGVRTLAHVLDTPARYAVRKPLQAVFGRSKGYGDDITGEGLHQALKWRDELTRLGDTSGLSPRDVAESYAARTVLAVPKLAGGLVGTALQAPTGIAGAISDIPSVVRGEQSLGDVWRNVQQLGTDLRDSATGTALNILTDPLSWVSFGVGGSVRTSAQNAARSAGRVAARAGKDAATARAISEEIAAVVGQHADTPQAAQAALQVMEKHGLGPAAQQAWGEDLRMLGHAQMSIHPPFMEGRGVDVLPAITGQEYAGAKALERVVDPVLAAGGRRGVYDPTRRQAKALQRAARAQAEATEQAGLEHLERELGGLPAETRLADKAVREEIKRRHIEPDFTRAEPGPGAPGSGQVDVPGARLTSADFVPHERLDEVFGPGAAQYVDTVRRYGEAKAHELVGAGVLDPKQIAKNPFSNVYLQRQYASNRGTFEDLVDEGLARRAGAPRPDKGRIGAEEGYPGGMSRTELETMGRGRIKIEDDPNKILAGYNRTAARAAAQEQLSQRMADTFGRPVAMGDKGLAASGKVVRNSKGEEVVLDADLFNMVGGTFDQSLSSMSKMLRSKGVGSTPQGRGLLAALQGFESLTQRWKGLVLRSPGYHVVNAMDDTAKAFVDGNTALPVWADRARRMRGNLGGVLRLGKDRKSHAAWIAEAEAQGIGLGAAERFDRAGLSSADRLKEAIPGGRAGAVRRTGRMASQALPAFGRLWESNAKLGHYLFLRGKGASPQEAARRTFDVLVDWSDKSKAEQVAGWLVPFVRYVRTAPELTARALGRSPGRLSALSRAVYNEDRPDDLEPKASLKRRAYSVARGPVAKALESARVAAGGGPLPEGSQLAVVPRLTFGETWNDYGGLADVSNLPEFVGTKLNPVAQALMEYGLERDMLMGTPLARPGARNLVPFGTPGMAGLDSAPEQASWARWLPQFLGSRGALLAANQAIGRFSEEANPVTLGRSYDFTSEEEAQNAMANQVLGYLTGLPVSQVDPFNALQNQVREPEIDEFMKRAQRLRRIDKANVRSRARP